MTKPAKKQEAVRAFDCDHRADNPALHNLYVEGAYEDLAIVREALDRMNERSRVPMTLMAGALHEAMQREVARDAAYFEAAALLFAGLEPPRRTAMGIDA